MGKKNLQRGNALVGLLVVIALVWGFSLFSGDTEREAGLNPTDYRLPAASSFTLSPNLTAPRHYDDDYRYNYRTGSSGSYEYNYDVEGYGDSGYVYGNVDTRDKYGEGYIYDEEGNGLWIETEWVDYGILEAYDEYGNWYELEVY